MLASSAELVPHYKFQSVLDCDATTQSLCHKVKYNRCVISIHPSQSHGAVVSQICQSSTTRRLQGFTDRSRWQGRSGKVAPTTSIWQGRSDRLSWQVALRNTSYSSYKHSANFIWPTITTYSPSDPGILEVTNGIWDTSSPQRPTKYFSAALVGLRGLDHKPTQTSTGRDMHCPTLGRALYLLKDLRYLLPCIGVLHRICHRPPTMCSFIMRYYLQCNGRNITPSFCSPSGWVDGHCPWRTGRVIRLDLRDHTISDWFCCYDSHSMEDLNAPYHNLPTWTDLQSMIPQWLRAKGLIV